MNLVIAFHRNESSGARLHMGLAPIWRVGQATMRATLVMYAAFVSLSLMLWSGCFGRRSASPEATMVVDALPSVASRSPAVAQVETLASSRLPRGGPRNLRQPHPGTRLASARRIAADSRADSTGQSTVEIRANEPDAPMGTNEWRSPRESQGDAFAPGL
jgi:hypothetical protein